MVVVNRFDNAFDVETTVGGKNEVKTKTGVSYEDSIDTFLTVPGDNTATLSDYSKQSETGFRKF